MTQMKVKYCYDCDGIYKATYEECPTCSARKQCVALTAQNAGLKREVGDLKLQLEDRQDSEYHLRETLKEVNAENLRLKSDLKEVRDAYEYYRKHAASILNNTADPEET